MTRYEANREIRRLLGITAQELADKVEVTKQTISNYENGKGTLKPVQRVIEWELDEFIKKCTDEDIVYFCDKYKEKRFEA